MSKQPGLCCVLNNENRLRELSQQQNGISITIRQRALNCQTENNMHSLYLYFRLD